MGARGQHRPPALPAAGGPSRSLVHQGSVIAGCGLYRRTFKVLFISSLSYVLPSLCKSKILTCVIFQKNFLKMTLRAGPLATAPSAGSEEVLFLRFGKIVRREEPVSAAGFPVLSFRHPKRFAASPPRGGHGAAGRLASGAPALALSCARSVLGFPALCYWPAYRFPVFAPPGVSTLPAP